MGSLYREYLNLFVKYEGDIGLATGHEIEHANGSIDPGVARRMAEAEYKRKVRIKNNETKKQNNPKGTVVDSSFPDSLF